MTPLFAHAGVAIPAAPAELRRQRFEREAERDIRRESAFAASRETPLLDEARAVRSRIAIARHKPFLRTLHRVCLLLDGHGEWARVELWRRRADGTAQRWGIDLDHADRVLAMAGVPPAGEQVEAFGGEA